MFFAGALLAKYKLESLRAVILQAAASRTGIQLHLDSVAITGLRGLRADGVVTRVEPSGGPVIQVLVPSVYLYIDVVDLLYGEVSIERLQADDAVICIERSPGQEWFSGDALAAGSGLELRGDQPFRVTGKRCRLELVNIVGPDRQVIEDLEFDAYRLAGSGDIRGSVVGAVGGSTGRRLGIDIQFRSPEDFELRASCDEVSADDVNALFPGKQPLVVSGRARPQLRVSGYPNGTVLLALEGSFEELAVRNQPEFVGPAKGTVTLLGQYDRSRRLLTVTTGKVDSDQIAGTLEGSVMFGKRTPPILDVRFEASRLPMAGFLDILWEGRLDEYGVLECALKEPHEVIIEIKGSAETPAISGRLSAGGADLSFAPKDNKYPRGNLQFGLMEATWDAETKTPKGTFSIVGGSLDHEQSGLAATNITGLLTLDSREVRIAPLNAVIAENSLVGTVSHDLAKRETRISVTGTLQGLENTFLHTAIKDTVLSGAASVKGEATIAANKWTMRAEAEATQLQVDYSWWFRKPAGMGLSGTVEGEFRPRRSGQIRTDMTASGSHIASVVDLVHNGSRWALAKTEALSDVLDIITVGKCLRIPYRVQGTTATEGRYVWQRSQETGRSWKATTECKIDEIVVQAQGAEAPMRLKGATVHAEMNKGTSSTGDLNLKAQQAWMPPIGTLWFVPLRPDPELLKKYPPTERAWKYDLSAASLEVPPWRGEEFKGEAYSNRDSIGLPSFGAKIGNGTLSGRYAKTQSPPQYTTTAKWNAVPATYFIQHLKLPEVFSGPISGEVTYTVTQGSPGALSGEGRFEAKNGRFSADYIFTTLAEQLKGEMGAVPPFLDFSTFSADVQFQDRVVKTPKLLLEYGDAFKMQGAGQFERGGDLNYQLTVKVSPDTAALIPVLRDNFNVQGHRLAKQDIELGFQLTGATDKPKGELAKAPPITVTLMSGALEVTSEAFQVIDAPRKILLDLLRIGGGIMGAAK